MVWDNNSTWLLYQASSNLFSSCIEEHVEAENVTATRTQGRPYL